MIAVGIDLGTTNTVLACAGKVLVLASGQDQSPLLPSVVSYLPTGATLVGYAARRRRALDPSNTIYSAKRVIGRHWLAHGTQEFRENYPFDMVELPDHTLGFRTRRGVITPVDVAATVIATALQRAGLVPAEVAAVVTAPAEFDQVERAATLLATRRAGVASARIEIEPVAALHAHQRLTGAAPQRVAVYDLGGGTFDFAVLELRDGQYQVLGSAGDPFLGGDDIDRALARHVARQVLQWDAWDLAADPETLDRLVLECERVKLRLCYAASASIELGQIDPAAPAALRNVTVDVATLNATVQGLIQSSFGICDEVLAQVGLTAARLDAVVLAGGTTLLPLVRDAVRQYFGREPETAVDPLEIVAIGASVLATSNPG